MRIKIDEIKKNLEESYNEKIQEINKHGTKIKDLLEQIKILKDKNNELLKELKKKENIIELMYKDNEKLVNQNNLNNIQIEQHSKQINDNEEFIKELYNKIIKEEEKDINTMSILSFFIESVYLFRSKFDKIKIDIIIDYIYQLINPRCKSFKIDESIYETIKDILKQKEKISKTNKENKFFFINSNELCTF